MTSGPKEMSAADAVKAMRGFAFADMHLALGEGGLVVIAPHPDDESLACGGLIAKACAEGRCVKVIVVSDGTGSHLRSRVYPRIRLRAIREKETRQAVTALGVAPRDIEFLRLRDRFVPSHGPLANTAVERIVAIAKKAHAQALFVSWRHDPHCDHQASYQLVRSAQRELTVALYEYSIWCAALNPREPVTPISSGFRIRIDRQRVRKLRAILAHRSQVSGMIADDPTGFRLSAADISRFSGNFESFIAGES